MTPHQFPPAIQTFALTKRFPAAERGLGLLPPTQFAAPAVDAVTLTVRQGELFGLLGPNGAGKTTLIKTLTTLITPTSGTATINGYDLSQEQAVKASIGLVTTDERSFYWRLTGRENLEFFAALHNLPSDSLPGQVEEVLTLVRLGEAADRDFKTCSTGMRQRLAIARALLHRPRTLFLDEPTRGLDPPAVRALHRLIREELTTRQGITVFLTTHWLQEAEKLCDRVAIMHKGRIRGCGTMSELRTLIGETERYRIRVGGLTPASRAHPEQNAVRQPAGGRYTPVLSETNVIPNDESILNRTIDAIRATGGTIQSLTLEQVPLETIFDRLTVGSEQLPVSSYQSAVGSQPTNQSPITNPQFPSFPRIALAFLKRDWRGEASYRLSFLLQFASVFFSVAVFYFVAQLLGEAAAPLLASYGGDYFAFVLIGIAFARYFGVGMSGFANSLRRAQTVGTLEAMLTTPTRLSAIILSSSLWSYGITTLQVLAYLVVGAVFLGVQLGRGNYAAALLVLILTIGVFNSLGILAASFIMVLKRGDPVTWIFNALFTFFGGVYYPIAVLPDWLEPVSNLLPVTYGLRAMRLALLQGASFGDLLPDILALALFSIALLPLSLLAFRYAVRRARVDGSLTHY